MPETIPEQSSIRIEKKTFITAFLILVLLIVTVGILTQIIPTGSYDRIVLDGREVLVNGTYHLTDVSRFPIWRWFTAPIEVLWSADAPVIIVIIFFLLAISAAFSLLDRSGVMSYVITLVVQKYGHVKYQFMAVIILIFMLMGAFLGTFEENIALVPLMIALAYCLGWDSLVGLGMSILASCFGFTAAIMNPFSIAITQQIAELPLYSGTVYRIIIFVCYYTLLYLFLMNYAKNIEKDPTRSLVYADDEQLRNRYRQTDVTAALLNDNINQKLVRKASISFGISLLMLTFIIGLASVIAFLADLTLPLIGLCLLSGGYVAAKITGLKHRDLLRVILKSFLGIAPGIVLILLAMSVKFIISNGGIMDTILYYTANTMLGTSPYLAVLLIYGLILMLELFVGSSSAKAFLVMPLIAPLADLIGVTRQTAVLAFCFGDGFSNVIYPTNPVLLICLGLTVVSFPKWFKWTYKLQLCALIMACIFLFIGVAISYGPF